MQVDRFVRRGSTLLVSLLLCCSDQTERHSAGFQVPWAPPNNPVLPGYNADPQVAVFNNSFYIYPTTDGFVNWTSTSFSVFSSTNFIDWTDRGLIFDLRRDLTWATDRLWAPGIVFRGGTFYLYFAAAQEIGVATSTSPTGPFKDALGHPLINAWSYGVQTIDPYPFIDDDGTPYLYFGSGGARVVRLNGDMISLAGDPENITPTDYNEGSVMFKRHGSYYFLWSENDTRSANYQVAYGRAQSPLGPFRRLGVILEKDAALGIVGTGHNSILALPGRDEYYMVYHRFAIPGGDGYHREVCIDRMFFNVDGTIVPVKPTLEGLRTAVNPSPLKSPAGTVVTQ
jgi:beta-xylosidase